jgi:2-succinyl-5-enolpyruvyl-6-hydroxy-3-cyclohexene-1-carboxylate synthase
MSKAVSDKKVVAVLVDVLKAHGVSDVVISPGSRSAPLVLAFGDDPDFHCRTIVDERSAGFFAMGMAQQLKRPVVLVCTSGSALLNYAPAVSEAYYQQIPLIVLSADRPLEWIDQGDGQTIRQQGVLDKHVHYNCQLPVDIYNEDDAWHVNRRIHEAIYHAMHHVRGPVHINIPFREPLYGRTVFPKEVRRVMEFVGIRKVLDKEYKGRLVKQWDSSSKIMILVGAHPVDEKLKQQLLKIGKARLAVVLTETLSNIQGEGVFPCIDRVVHSISEEEATVFQPDLLISDDGAIVSKMVKTYLRKYPPKYHWQVSESHPLMDTYQHLTHAIPLPLSDFLEDIYPSLEPKKSRYFDRWQHRFERSMKHHFNYLKDVNWCDLKMYQLLAASIPDHFTIQWGNSTVVRYSQLFDKFHGLESYGNRGTSGIDGCVSTAVGASHVRDTESLLVTGDLSFLYDRNGIWNKYVSPQLRIIVVNNGGGGIFRFIPGPADSGHLEEHFEVRHQQSVQPLAEMHGFEYLCATNSTDFERMLKDFFEVQEKPVLLEVITPSKENAKLLKAYFKRLKEEI